MRDLRTYIALEEALTGRLVKEWQKKSVPVYRAIAELCREGQWDKARLLVPKLDFHAVGTENREWIKYQLRSMAIFGAKLISKETPSFLAIGSFDETLNRVAGNVLQYLQVDATNQVHREMLQLIAEDEQKVKALKREFKYGNTQIMIDDLSPAGLLLNEARFSIADTDLAGHGKDVDPNHVTVRYGLEDTDVDRLRGYLAGLQPFEASLTGVEIFPPSEHSEGAAVLVARVASHHLAAIEAKIGQYAQFKEKSFPDYKPHCTIAYVKPEAVEQYRSLFVGGTLWVDAITISHRNGVHETIPLGMVRKADITGRFVTPHVRFDNTGDEKLQLIASLNASRLATWGFTAEAEVRGVQEYTLKAVLDGRTSAFCQMVHGTTFRVSDARKKILEVLNVQNPDDLRAVQPWPRQTKANLEELKSLTPEQLVGRGLHIPPFHPGCRTICVAAGDTQYDVVPLQSDPAKQMITQQTLKELGIDASEEEVSKWNAILGLSPVDVLTKLTGKSPKELLSGVMGKKAIQFEQNGGIAFSLKGMDKSVKYAVGATIDPFTGVMYLTEGDFLVGQPGDEAAFLTSLLHGLIETGQASLAKTLVLKLDGNVIPYVKMGFLPTKPMWDQTRVWLLEQVESGDLSHVYHQLTDEQKLLLQHLLHDTNEQSFGVLADLAIDIEGKPLNAWLLENVGGEFAYALEGPKAI